MGRKQIARTLFALHDCVLIFSFMVNERRYDVEYIVNSLLGSLVSITGEVLIGQLNGPISIMGHAMRG